MCIIKQDNMMLWYKTRSLLNFQTMLQVKAWQLVVFLVLLHRAPSTPWKSSKQGWQSVLLAPTEELQMLSQKSYAKKATRLSSGELSCNTPLSLFFELGCQPARLGQINLLVSMLYSH